MNALFTIISAVIGIPLAIIFTGIFLFWIGYSLKKLFFMTELDHLVILNGIIAVAIVSFLLGKIL